MEGGRVGGWEVREGGMGSTKKKLVNPHTNTLCGVRAHCLFGKLGHEENHVFRA